MDYWHECITEAFDDAGITATEEQVQVVCSWVQGAHENYGMAHGHDCITNPLVEQNVKLAKELNEERAKRTCPVCNGRGRLVIQGPCHSSESECYKCKGEGRL